MNCVYYWQQDKQQWNKATLVPRYLGGTATTLAELNERSDEKEERLRDRYDQTIAKIDLEKKAQADKALEEIRALGVKVEDMTRFLSRPPVR